MQQAADSSGFREALLRQLARQLEELTRGQLVGVCRACFELLETERLCGIARAFAKILAKDETGPAPILRIMPESL